MSKDYSKRPKKELSIIIVNYNSGDLLDKCIKSIPKDRYEVIVVDNGSKDESLRIAKKNSPYVKYIPLPKNYGFAKACNIGAKKACSSLLLFLNQDTKVIHKGIRECIKFLKSKKRIGAVSGTILNSDMTIQSNLRRFPRIPLIFFGRKSLLTKLFPNNRFSRKYMYLDTDFKKPQKVEAIGAVALFTKKKVFEEIGGFDSSFFLYFEDIDLCYRLWKKNWEVWYYPSPTAVHYMGEKTHPKRKYAEMHHYLSFYKFVKKHRFVHTLLLPFLWLIVSFRVVLLLLR